MHTTVIVTLDNDRKIIDTSPFISDEQFQKILVAAKKKGQQAKITSSEIAKRCSLLNLPLEN